MNNDIIHALDFDGVLCDSALETGITGWKAATRLWPDMKSTLPAQELNDQFRIVRPIIETGYEAILVMRMLYQGTDIQSILSDFSAMKTRMLKESGLLTDDLKQLFGSIRDNWIDTDLPDWINMNPLFPGIARKLANLSNQGLWYIVTTKQERFVSQILAANQIDIPMNRIFGLDRKMSKVDVLTELANKHPATTLHFVEDRLPTLKNVLNQNHLKDIQLFFALWGYNTETDKKDAVNYPVERINLNQFLV